MTEYVKFTVGALASLNSDYSNPWMTYLPDAYVPGTAPTVIERKRIVAATGGTAIDLDAAFGTVNAVVIKNEDTTNYVRVVFDTKSAPTASVGLQVSAGQILVLTDVDDTTITITANSADVACDILIVGV